MELTSTYKYHAAVRFGDDTGAVSIAVYDPFVRIGTVLGYGDEHNSLTPVTAAKVGALIGRAALREHYGDDAADDAIAAIDAINQIPERRYYRADCTCVAGCAMCDADTPSRDGRDKDGNQIDNPMALAAIPRKALDIIRRLAADPTSWDLPALTSEARALSDYISENQLAL